MSFRSQFSSYFNAQEKETELYKMWLQIGMNTEKALLEEQEQLNAEFTDINSFSEDTARSWLSFFLKKIPYRITSKLLVTIKDPGTIQNSITIPDYSTLTSNTGYPWILVDGFTLGKNSLRSVTLVQGKKVEENGTYDSIIKIHCSNPDLDYLSVYIDGKEVPEVSFDSSYDYLKYKGSWSPKNGSSGYGGTPFLTNITNGTTTDSEGNVSVVYRKGDMYNVTEEGRAKFYDGDSGFDVAEGDVIVFNGNIWTLIKNGNGIIPFQWQNQYAIPANGYYAYYYDNYLYIKIFQGTDVDNPKGLKYNVIFIESDGKAGELSSTDFVTFDSEFEDGISTDIYISPDVVSSDASSVAVNEPFKGKLGLMIKERMFASINVSSIPEYTAWFKAQPEVGDCVVQSDHERWLASGKTSEYAVTGIVTVNLLNRNGEELTDTEKELIDERLSLVKDIAFVQYTEGFTPSTAYFHICYSSVINSSRFMENCEYCIKRWYDVDYLQQKGGSLFSDVSLSTILNEIMEYTSDNSPQGVTIDAYHFITNGTATLSSLNWNKIYTLGSELIGGANYLLKNGSGEIVGRMFEVVTNPLNKTAVIYAYYKNGDTPIQCGTRNSSEINVLFSNAYPNIPSDISTWTFEAYLPMENEGVLSVGVDNGRRVFGGLGFNDDAEFLKDPID